MVKRLWSKIVRVMCSSVGGIQSAVFSVRIAPVPVPLLRLWGCEVSAFPPLPPSCAVY